MTGEGPGSEVDTGADRAGARPDLRVLQAGPEAEIFRLARAALAHRYAVVHRAVADEAELRAALRAGEWDVLLCDPRAEGADCKALFGELGESASEVVAIAVSEREEEPLAAELISLGARAVLGRARLGRLAPIVARELENLRRRRLKELRALLDTSPDPMLIADADGRIRYASRRLEALLGYLPDELTGKPVETLVPEHLRAQHTVERARYARGPVPWPLGAGGELVALHKDGTPIPVEISLGPLRLGGETFVCCGLRDLRERRRAERLLRAILEGTAAATGEEFLRALVRNLAQALEVRFAFVSVLEPSAPGRARVLAFWNGDAYLAPHEYPLASSPCETVLAQGELLVRDGLGARFGGESRLRDLGAQGFFGVRLAAASGEPLGVLAIADLAPLGEVDTARTVLRIFAARAAAELERARIAAQLAARERWFRDMAELSSDWYWEQDENFRFVPLTQTDSGGHAPWLDWVVGKTRWEVASEGLSEEQWAEHRRKLEAHEEFRDFEYPARPPGGQPRWMSVSGRPVYDADGRFRGYRGVARDVTARRAMEQALRESEARFREIFRAAPDMMTLVRRRDGTYLDVNPAFEEFTGYRRDEALGRTSRDLGIWAEPARREEMFRELARTGQLRDFEYAMRRRDGTIRHHLLSASALEIAGEPCYLFVIRDVTDRRRAEEALRESEERFRALVELSSDWYWQTDEQHRFVFREGEILYRMGIPPADDYGKTRWELDFVNMTEADWAAHRALLERREEFRDLLLARRSPDGRIHWATISGRPLYDRSGRFLGYHGTGRDITAQMRAEQALRASEAELRLLADNLPAMIFHVAPDLRLRYANRSFVEFYLGEGVSPEGKRMDELLGPSAFAAIMPALTRARRGESVHYRARRRRRSDGSMRDLDVALIPLRDADGTVRGVVGLILDVTERVGMEESLRIRNRALEASINAVIIAQPTARGQSIVYVNPAFERITGYSAAEVIGRDPNFLHGEDREQPGVAALRAALAEEREATVLVRNYRKDGTPYWSELRVAPVRDENGRVTHFVGISADVTERVEAEQRLQALAADLERRVAERTRELQAAVRELESFSYTVSHDLRAPLRAIAGFAHLLREEAGGALGDEARRLLGRIEANAMHMGALIDGLLALSRYSRQPLHRTAVDVAAIVREALETLESEVRARNAEVLIGELPPCRADPLLLRQVYANLLSNALKYSAGRGRPRIEVGARREDDETVYFVRDNGVGFDMRYAGRLFGVFERLHSASEFPGIGIGLSTVRRIVERHGGRVWAEAAPDAGATFFFTLGRGEDEGR